MTTDAEITQLLRETNALAARLVLSFEKIAASVAGINDTYKRQVARQYPERGGEVREAVVTRVPTQEDRLREEQGASLKSISDWLSELEAEQEEEPGTREKEWLDAQRRSSQDSG